MKNEEIGWVAIKEFVRFTQDVFLQKRKQCRWEKWKKKPGNVQ